MNKKPLRWCGSSYKDIKDDGIFTPNARKQAGYQLDQVQSGEEPDDWKPFDVVGAGTKEIRINLDDGWFRVMYVAKFHEAVYVLHCFRKKSLSRAVATKILRPPVTRRLSKKGVRNEDRHKNSSRNTS